ncbi:hypothetical protein ACPOL_0796 [Acidisarcina polymorpha]|uniref:Uncharacterized protein n=1 Tax=Acidisarcina polymorpha TaxID=2211140 RepID=A0A2Z5FUH8_9BACT|nr:hypothetical protein ACPOL_0796 [Acidisarcina polymorpha]
MFWEQLNHEETTTVDNLRGQAWHSQYNGYSLRRDPHSFDSTSGRSSG